MKNLLIIGARGFGREVYNLFREINPSDIRCKGFLDDKLDALDGYLNYPPILSSVEDYEIQRDDVFVCALGDVKSKRKYVEIIRNRGGQFVSLIHPKTDIGINTTIGEGCIVRREASINCDIRIGDFVTIMGYSVLGHDCKVDNWCHLGAYSFLGGFSKLEEMVTLHPNAKILPHKTVKRGATVGAGSVVIRTVPEQVTVFGIPAKKLTM